MVQLRRLCDGDVPAMRAMLAMFGEAFGEVRTYTGHPPSDAYLKQRLQDQTFLALAAQDGDRVVGGLAAYELRKFEQERSEVYIYDLAVAASHRRQGIATGLIEAACQWAASRGAWVMYVQADTGPDDAAAIALYSKLGTRERVLHFDIAVLPGKQDGDAHGATGTPVS